MLRSLTWPQLEEWMEYDATCPIGDVRGDWQAASICAATANTLIAVHGGKKHFHVKDFLLEFVDEEVPKKVEAKSWQEMKLIAQMMVAASGSEERRKKRR
jgi:hypothetical protein